MKSLFIFLLLFCSLSQAEEQVRLQLNWTHQFQFAGYYAAKALGYYKNAGLDVALLKANPDAEPVEAVLRGPELITADYMFEGRGKDIAQTYAEPGILPDDFSLDRILYQTESKKDYFWIFLCSGVMLIIVIIALLVYILFSKLNKKLLRLLHIKSQFANIGESINHISHQWKQPLNELSLQIMLIEKNTHSSQMSSKEKKEIDQIASKCHDIMELMASKVDLFGNLLSTNKSTTSFQPGKCINYLLQLIEQDFKIHHITITTQLDEDITLLGNKYEMTHVLLNILNNARDIFEQRRTESPFIHIHLYQLNGLMHLDISDNGGGIKIKPVDNIFKPGYSNKKASDSGVGLYIAKNIIEENYQGHLSATTTETGATFKITIPVLGDH